MCPGDEAHLTKKKVKPSITDPLLVIIRHGKTEYNKLGVFTGYIHISIPSFTGHRRALFYVHRGFHAHSLAPWCLVFPADGRYVALRKAQGRDRLGSFPRHRADKPQVPGVILFMKYNFDYLTCFICVSRMRRCPTTAVWRPAMPAGCSSDTASRWTLYVATQLP